MPDKAAAAEHNGDICAKPPTQDDAILAEKISKCGSVVGDRSIVFWRAQRGLIQWYVILPNKWETFQIGDYVQFFRLQRKKYVGKCKFLLI